MTRDTKERLSRQSHRRRYLMRLLAGCENIGQDKRKLLGLLLILLMGMVLYLGRTHFVSAVSPDILIPMLTSVSTLLIPMVFALLVAVYLLWIGTPHGAGIIADDLHRAGLVNALDEPPMLMQCHFDSMNPRIEILEFWAAGIPIPEWENLRDQIQSALNRFIVEIKGGNGLNRILLYTVPYTVLPDVLPWDPSHLTTDGHTLVLGQTVAGTDVTIDITTNCHILIGGTTGSGKSVLLKLLLKQCMDAGMDVYIADFKGGVDFNATWEDQATIVLSMGTLITILKGLVAELEARKEKFRMRGVSNLDAYNKSDVHKLQLRRIVIACDEVAELLDKIGATKNQKAQIDEIISYLSTIARQGRAFGLHLILGTQRPDANILPGQIKNNMDVRLCGRADNVLSQIILDKTDAADLIPKDSHLFMMYDGTILQPYYYKDGAG